MTCVRVLMFTGVKDVDMSQFGYGCDVCHKGPQTGYTVQVWLFVVLFHEPSAYCIHRVKPLLQCSVKVMVARCGCILFVVVRQAGA